MRPHFDRRPTRIVEGQLFQLAQQIGRRIDFNRDKNPIRCPFHDDRHASAFVSRRNVFYCSVCTPNKGISAREFAARLGLPWNAINYDCASLSPFREPQRREFTFTADMARAIWASALRRAVDEVHAEDQATIDYVRKRRLDRAWEAGLLGFVDPDCTLSYGSTPWFQAGVRLVAPLHDLRGAIVNLQGRNVLFDEPRLLFPKGGEASGTVFANPLGLAVLRGELRPPLCVLGEGLTDFLGLSGVPGLAVLSAPGASMTRSAVGDWVRGQNLVLAFDADKTGTDARDLAGHIALGHGAARISWIEWPGGCNDACDLLGSSGPETLDLFFCQHAPEAYRG